MSKNPVQKKSTEIGPHEIKGFHGMYKAKKKVGFSHLIEVVMDF